MIMSHFRRIPITVLLLTISLAVAARQWTSTNYLVADGLPANNTLALTIDGRGFLWIGTENGLARFDGNHFQTFSTVHGLPDNEIRSLSTDGSGNVVVWTYQHDAVVFDPPGNRFLAAPGAFRKEPDPVISSGTARYSCDSFRLYKAQGNRAYSRSLPFGPAHLTSSGRQPVLVSDNGLSAALIDTASLQPIFLPLGGALARNVLEDGQGNIWISTGGQGLLKLSVLPAISYNSLLPANMAPAVVCAANGLVICGDDKGRIAVFRQGCLENMLNISRWSRAISRIRAILPLPDGYFVAVEGDASLKLDRSFQIVSVYNRPYLNHAERCAALWNDSVILAGGNEHAVRLNLHSCVASDTVSLRSTVIAADRKGRVWMGTANGLYRRDDTGLVRFHERILQLAARIGDMCATADGLIWLGLPGKQLVALRDDSVIDSIALDRGLPGTRITSLCAGKPGELWIGSDKGLSRLRYALNGRTLKRSITAFGPMDGISGQVADLGWQSDTVYVAGSGGLFAFPDNAEPLVTEIPVFITGISINDRDTVIRADWSVAHDLNDWTIRFAGIDPAASEPVFQYRINGDSWQNADGSTLSLRQLAPGFYNIRIRALRRDGRPSAGGTELRIRIATPFWSQLWFWALLFIVFVATAVLILQVLFRSRRARQLKRLQSEHALATSQQQTFSALMNPHFIFNALNSIQHFVLAQDKRLASRYLSGFGRLIRMNFESAQQSFINLGEELERLRLYLELEQMRFGEKLQWEIVVVDDPDMDELQIPAMILQPFLENALMHGIGPSKTPGTLRLTIERLDRQLRITIRDNGIGIGNSKRLRLGNGHQSRGMELIRRRLQLLQQIHGERIGLRIHDADPTHQEQPGTEVELLIPILPV